MAFDAGINGDVSSWSTGDDVADLLSNIGSYRFSANIVSDTLDATVFDSSGVVAMANIPGLASITGTIDGRFKAGGPITGNTGLVTYSSGGYVVGANRWSISMNWSAFDVTAFDGSTPPTWKDFIQGPLSWTATVDALVDSGTALDITDLPGSTAATVTFKLSEEGATDNTIAGAGIVSTTALPGIEPNTLSAIRTTITGSGNLTFAGSSNIIAAGTIGIPTYNADNLVLKTTAGQDIEGLAFPTGITLTCGVNEVTNVSVNFQGTGVWS